ncbi:hypothetical protein C8J57DRAFT_1628955 [Mycena rebaudengoi]|nr:hypothetical protein C8J57DRAFT_1628955 [Mycena rebaudengoi]
MSAMMLRVRRNAGYLGGYDANTGDFVGAIGYSVGSVEMWGDPWLISLAALDTSGDPSNYLAVVVFSTRILSPVDPVAGYVSLICGTILCGGCAFSGSTNPFVAISAADGNPLGPFPTPGFTANTFAAGYGNLHTYCGENQVWVLGSAVGRQVLVPSWRDPSGSESGTELLVGKLTEFELYTRTFSFCWMRRETNSSWRQMPPPIRRAGQWRRVRSILRRMLRELYAAPSTNFNSSGVGDFSSTIDRTEFTQVRISIQMTTDMGNEVNEAHKNSSSSGVSGPEFPFGVRQLSTKNTPIESFLLWLRKGNRMSVKLILQQGVATGIFLLNDPIHNFCHFPNKDPRFVGSRRRSFKRILDWTNHTITKSKKKMNPGGSCSKNMPLNPASVDVTARDCSIRVNPETVAELREAYGRQEARTSVPVDIFKSWLLGPMSQRHNSANSAPPKIHTQQIWSLVGAPCHVSRSPEKIENRQF